MTTLSQTEKPATTGPATAIGFVSILLWGALALLTTLTGGRIPEFQLLAMTFTLAFCCMLVKWALLGQNPLRYLRQPAPVWLLGIGGLFGYHLFYFIALGRAPAVEASLLAYLWPLLIVLLSALLPGEQLRLAHLLGALLSLAGCWVLIGAGGSFDAQYLIGYLAAAACALIWSGYSVASRLFKAVPTDTVGWFCGATALLAWCCHFAWEQTVWPVTTLQWLGVLGLGLGPVGIAFFTWDYGIKHGNLQLLGVLAYSAPLISTLLLIAAGQAQGSSRVLFACGAIVVGALIAGVLGRRRPAG
ncbi:aromatic amino acid exporter YddG [Marinobacterium arenosum]|uniref:aromatic amino acid exporter YddG n=1 Tax=Marinobacterium arenosum TaxID=2862496 RepID=UPI001C96A985|nr:EamA family transporter [Marinobacterium arenosum]MBY4675843.1 EamA family transporter [Marinobacterium arenosum]